MITPRDIKHANPAYLSASICAQLSQYGLKLSSKNYISRNFMYNAPVLLYGNAAVRRVRIDAYSYIADNSTIRTSIIGRYCSIGDRVCMGLGYHEPSAASTSPVFGFRSDFSIFTGPQGYVHNFYLSDEKCGAVGEETSQVTVGHDVWVGSGACFPKTVTIGTGAVIGAHCVITKDVPPYAIMIPGERGSQILRHRFRDEIISDLLELEWWRYDLPGYASKHNKTVPIEDIRGFISFVKNEDLSSFVIQDNWRYLEIESSNQIKLHNVAPDFDMALAAPLLPRDLLEQLRQHQQQN